MGGGFGFNLQAGAFEVIAMANDFRLIGNRYKNKTDGFFLGPAGGAGDAGNPNTKIRFKTFTHAPRHGGGRLRAYRSKFFEMSRWDVKEFDLGFIAVGDEAEFKKL